jgi:hypothetical protein
MFVQLSENFLPFLFIFFIYIWLLCISTFIGNEKSKNLTWFTDTRIIFFSTSPSHWISLHISSLSSVLGACKLLLPIYALVGSFIIYFILLGFFLRGQDWNAVQLLLYFVGLFQLPSAKWEEERKNWNEFNLHYNLKK